MKEKITNKNGDISILLVIMILMFCTMLSSMLDVSTSQWGFKETQSQLDIAGTNALYNSIDLESLKFERLDIGGSSIGMDGSGADSLNSESYTSVIKRNYTQELSEVTYGGASPDIRKVNVDFVYSNTGLGYVGQATKKRPQVALESIVAYTVDSTVVSDIPGLSNSKSIKSSLSNTTIHVSLDESETVAEDGKVTLLIHCETKIVLK